MKKKKSPTEVGAPVPLLVPCVLARTRRPMRRSTSEPAARCVVVGTAGSTAGRRGVMVPASGTAILHGLARRTAPQTPPPRSGSRASRGRHKKAPPGLGLQRG